MKNQEEMDELVTMMIPFASGAESLIRSEEPLWGALEEMMESTSYEETRISLLIAQCDMVRRFLSHPRFTAEFHKGLSKKGLI